MSEDGQTSALLDLIDDPVAILSEDVGLALNAAARPLFPSAEDRAALAGFFEDGDARLGRLLAAARRTTNAIPGGLVYLKDGEAVRLQCRANRLPGMPVRVAIAFRKRTTDRFRALTAKVDELNAEVLSRKRAEIALERAVARNELLLQELRHRVKNNVAIMLALLQQQQSRTDDPVLRQFVKDATGRLGALFAAQQHIFDDENEGLIPIGKLADVVVDVLRSGTDDVSFEVKIEEDFPVREEEANAVGLLLNELMTNCIKHAGKKGLRVTVLAAKDGDHRLLTVRDDGTGFAPDTEGAGLGSRIVAGLARQLAGAVARYNEGGAVVTVRLPGVGAEQ